MVSVGQLVRWARALLAMPVAIALLFAPMAGAMTGPCHDRIGYQQDHGDDHDVAASAQPASSTVQHQDQPAPNQAAGDFKNCCSASCGISLTVIARHNPATPARLTARSRLEWNDQGGRGIAFPPTLGPPRFSI